ncbi:MAG: hypothetical protein LQ347_007063 [Umbilicaria vellea]|nr:MAG: hypothetical protein LQ347_007063 [Umbilicaria vellea]
MAMARKASKPKTLYEIAAERQAELQKGQPFAPAGSQNATPSITTTRINPDGTLSHGLDSETGGVVSPTTVVANAVFTAVTLSMLHFTFDVLVHHQYAVSISWSNILRRTGAAFPALLLTVYMLQPRSQLVYTQALYLVMGVAAGCYLVYVSNEQPYFAVMKRAPALGTLWIWSVIEMRLDWAAIALGAVGAFYWGGGYSIS